MRLLLTAISFCIFFSSTSLSHIQAKTSDREEYEKAGKAIWEVKTNEKMVAITFDDGPHSEYTPKILDILAKYNAKATFFVAGNKVESCPQILQRIVKEGHEVGNHTYHHYYDKNITEEKLSKELEETKRIIWKTAHYTPKLYRPVGGYHNDLIVDTAVKHGYLVTLWSWQQDPRDWANPPAYKISDHIIKALQPGNIILLHDWSYKPQTVEALETTLEYLYKHGYEAVTVSELLFRSETRSPKFFNTFPVK